MQDLTFAKSSLDFVGGKTTALFAKTASVLNRAEIRAIANIQSLWPSYHAGRTQHAYHT